MRTSSPFHPHGASIFHCVKILPGLLRGGSTGNVDFLGSERSFSHFRRIHTSLGLQTFGVLTRLSWSHFRRTHAPLVLTLPVYSRAACIHTSGVLTRRSSFSRYLSRPAWSRRSPLTHLVWARCSRGIRQAWRGLVTVLRHTLRGLVVLAVSVMPGVVASRSSHTSCVGSLFIWGLVVAAPVSRVERDRSVERDNTLFYFYCA